MIVRDSLPLFLLVGVTACGGPGADDDPTPMQMMPPGPTRCELAQRADATNGRDLPLDCPITGWWQGRYKIDQRAGMTYEIGTALTGPGKVRLTILDERVVTLALADNSVAWTAISDAPVSMLVETFNDAGAPATLAPFTISAGAFAAEADDHGNSSDGATVLALGAARPGAIAPATDVDVFRIDLEAGTTYRVQATLADTFQMLSDLVAPSGETVAIWDNEIRVVGSKIFVAPESGSYVIHVLRLTGPQGAYSIVVEALVDTISDTTDDALAIALPYTLASVIEEEGDVDYFKLELADGETIKVMIFANGEVTADGEGISVFRDTRASSYDNNYNFGGTFTADRGGGTLFLKVHGALWSEYYLDVVRQ